MDYKKLSFSSQNGVRLNELSNEVAKYLLVSGLTLINSPHILSGVSRTGKFLEVLTSYYIYT